MRIIRNRPGKAFYRYMISYITVLLIPLVLSIAFYDKSRDLVNEESQRANELLLAQMTSYLDVILNNTQQLTHLISFNQRIERLMYETLPLDGRDQYTLYQLSREFDLYRKANKNILDFYVYFPGIDRVVSPWGIHTSKQYLENWIPSLELSRREWLSQFTAGNDRLYVESFTEMTEGYRKQTIARISPIHSLVSLENPLGWLIIHMDKEYFHNVFKNTMWTDETFLILYYEDSGIVTTSNPEINLSQLPLPFIGHEETSLNEFDYITMSMKSEIDPKFHYVLFVPENIYRGQFRDLRRFAFVLLLSAFLVGSFFIYRFSTARYKPVRRLLELLNPAGGNTVSLQSDEFALIARSMELTIKEDERLKEDLKRSESILAQRFMKQLLNGSLKFDDDARKILSGYGVKFSKSCITLVLIDIELDEEAGPEVRDRFIQELWFAEQRQSLFTIRDLGGAVGFLINHEEGEFGALEERVERQKSRAESQLPLFLAIGISNVHHHDEELSLLYDEAQTALDFRLVRSRKHPIKFSDVKTSKRSYYYPVKVEMKMINSIKAGDRKASTAILEEVYARNFSENLPNLEIARCLMFDLISTMIKTLNEIPTIEEDSAFWENAKPITTLMNCRSFDQLRTEMGEILERVCDYVIAGKPNKNDVLLKEIVHFIEKNYRDKNLSPDLIASHLHRNKAYLCRCFRDHEGLGVSSYIKQHRVGMAKELMSDVNISVVDIADEVGFSGSNSFIRAFKELEGVTPGQYLSAISR